MGGKVITGPSKSLSWEVMLCDTGESWGKGSLLISCLHGRLLLFFLYEFFQPGSPCSKSSKKHHLHLFIPQVDQWLTICSCHIFLPILWFLFKLANSFQHKDSPMSVLKSLSVRYTFHSGRWFFNISLYGSPFNEGWPSCLTPLQQLKQQLNQR